MLNFQHRLPWCETNQRIQWNKMECVYFIFDSSTLIKLWKRERSKGMTKKLTLSLILFFIIRLSYTLIVYDIIGSFSSIWAIIRQQIKWWKRIKSIHRAQLDENANILWLLSSKYKTYKIFMLVCNIAVHNFSLSLSLSLHKF